MSASNYIISSGESLDDIFEKRNSQQQSAQATNYYNTDGQDLNIIFLKKSSSSTAATTTNYKVSGNDLNTIFEPLNTSSTVGSIVIWPSTTIPDDYLLCDGSSYSTTDSTYSSLYSAIGTTYGSSSGYFNVPDFTTNSSKTFMSSTYSKYTGGNNNLDISSFDWASHNHTIDTSTIDFTHTHTLSQVGSGTQYTGALGTNYMTQINNDGDGDFQFLSGQQLESGGAEVQTMTLNSEAEYTAASIPGQSNNTPSSRDSTIEILNPYITIKYIIKYQ